LFAHAAVSFWNFGLLPRTGVAAPGKEAVWGKPERGGERQ